MSSLSDQQPLTPKTPQTNTTCKTLPCPHWFSIAFCLLLLYFGPAFFAKALAKWLDVSPQSRFERWQSFS